MTPLPPEPHSDALPARAPSRLPAAPFHAVPLVMSIGAATWFLLEPGFGRFFLAALAFFLWVLAWTVEKAFRFAARGKRHVERIVGEVHRYVDPASAGEMRRHELPETGPYRPLWDHFEGAGDASAAPATAGNVRREARAQLLRLARGCGAFESTLAARLNPGELTYARYLSSANGVRDLALETLAEVAIQLRALPPPGGPGATAAAAEPRLARARELLAANERALAQLDATCGAVAEMGTGSIDSRSRSLASFEDAVNDLAELARRARKY